MCKQKTNKEIRDSLIIDYEENEDVQLIKNVTLTRQ